MNLGKLVCTIPDLHNKSHIQLAVWRPVISILVETIIISSWMESDKLDTCHFFTLVPQWGKCLNISNYYMRPDIYHLLPICHVSLYNKVRINFLAPECCLSDFSENSLHFIVYLQTLQNLTHTTVTVITQTKHHLSYIDHPLCQTGSLLPCDMAGVSVVPDTRL